MVNNLPKYWKVDTTNDLTFRERVVDYIIDQTGDSWSPGYNCYGYTGEMNNKSLQGFDASDDIESLNFNAPIQLTYHQFIEAIETEYKERGVIKKSEILRLIEYALIRIDVFSKDNAEKIAKEIFENRDTYLNKGSKNLEK